MSQLGWVQILYDQQLTSIGYLLSAKIAIETQQFFCPPKPRVVGSIPASRTRINDLREFSLAHDSVKFGGKSQRWPHSACQ